MSYRVLLAPETRDQLEAIEQYIADTGAPLTAARYVDAIVSFCQELRTFPARGVSRDDLLPGLRLTHYRKRTVIAFLVDEAAQTVSIVGVFYGGQDWESHLIDEPDNGAS